MATLYRKYRPAKFSEIFGQEHIKKAFEAAFKEDRLTHAYLFHGPRGTGKTTTARILAARLNCAKPKGADPCGKCNICTESQGGKNLDITEIDAASHRGIDDIRALQERVVLKPAIGTHKVYIVDEVHMLTREAFTALLKTLEEPVPHAVFILATTEFHKVPETIISRSQVFRFRRANDEEMSERLSWILKQEKREVDEEALKFIIKRSDGCFRDAESLLDHALATQPKKVTLDNLQSLLGVPPQEQLEIFVNSLVDNDAAGALKIAEDLYNQGFDIDHLVQESIALARDMAVAQVPDVNPKLPEIVRALVAATQDLSYVPQPMIALQLAVLTVCKGSAPAPAAKVVPAVAVTAKPAASAPETSPPVEAKERSNAPGSDVASPELQEIKQAWTKIIEKVKEKSPVAATFLRAMEATVLDGNNLTITASYPLHNTFFQKAENIEIVVEVIKQVCEKDLQVKCALAGGVKKPQAQTAQQKDDVVDNLKEVFGDNVKA